MAVANTGAGGARSIQPIALSPVDEGGATTAVGVVGNLAGGVPIQAVPTAAAAPMPTQNTSGVSSAAQDSFLAGIVNNTLVPASENGGISPSGAAEDILSALQSSSEFTAAQDTAIIGSWNSSNNPVGGLLTDKGGGNTALEQTDWLAELERGLATVPNALAQPVVGSGPATPLTPLSPPTTTLTPPSTGTGVGVTNSPTVANTIGGGGNQAIGIAATDPSAQIGGTSPTSTTTGTGYQSIISQLLPLLTGQSAGAAGSSGSSGSSGSGGTADVAGTSTPISSLGALTPIGTPTSTSSSGSSSAIIVVGVVLVGAVALWLWERNRKKKQQGHG